MTVGICLVYGCQAGGVGVATAVRWSYLMVATLRRCRDLQKPKNSFKQGCGARAGAKALFWQVGAGAGSRSQTYGFDSGSGSDLK